MTVKFTLKEARKSKDWSQERLARESGVSVSYVQKIEQNQVRRIALDTVDKLCHALECDISDLLVFIKDVQNDAIDEQVANHDFLT